MKTPRPVTRFAADILGVVSLRLQARVGGRAKIARDRLVTGGALLRPDKFSTRDARRRQDGVVRFEAAAGKQNEGERDPASDHPPDFFAPPEEPTS